MYVNLEMIPMMIGITLMSAGLAGATLAFAYSSRRLLIVPSLHDESAKWAKRIGWLVTIGCMALSPIIFGLFTEFIKTYS